MQPIVATSYGRLAGRSSGGVTAYLGIPYAAPPVGSSRWRPPAPPVPWDGVRDAGRPGPSAPQADTSGSPTHQLVDMREHATSEDCLYLNVWTPADAANAANAAADTDSAAAEAVSAAAEAATAPTGAPGTGGPRRPVLVWLHGGAFVIGSGSLPMYEGHVLAATTGAVVVTVNYRLGALGWLRAPELGATGNEGLLDQLAALAWVQREVTAFGGDPTNVTVFGESAGAASIAAMLARPGPKPFRRAVLQSGAHNLIHPPARADQAAGRLATHLGARPADWRGLPLDAVLDAQNQATPRSAGIFYAPVADGVEVPEDPLGAIAAGSARGVALLVGTNRTEMGFFWGPDPRTAALDEAGLLRGVRALAGGDEARARDLVNAYTAARARRGEDTSPAGLWLAIGSDATFRLPAIALCEAQSPHATVHAYLFDWPSPALDGRVGSGHLLEVPFVFGTHRHPTCVGYTGADHQPGADELAAAMTGAWGAFAHSGDPGWPAYDARARLTQRFGRVRPVDPDPYGPERRAWAR